MPENTNDAVENINSKAIEMIKASGVLNPKMPLEEVLNLTQKLQALHAGSPKDARHTDWFIHSHFIFSHVED
jgi:hypothetical protein